MAEKTIDRLELAETYDDASPEEEEQEDSIDILALLVTLDRGKKTILAISAVCFLIATLVAFLLPPKFTSSASFIPPTLSGNSSMASAVAGQLSALGAGDLLGGAGKTPGELYSAILRSRSIASELSQRFDLIHVYGVKKESQAEEVLEAETAVTVDAKSTVVTLSVSGKSPKLAHDLANGYLDALRETEGRLALGQSSQRRMFFGQQLAKEKDDLEDAEVEMKKTEEQTGLIAPTGQTEAEIRTIAETQAQMAARQVQLAALRQAATEQNPEVVRLQSEIEDLRGQLARLQNGGGKGGAAGIPTSKVPQVQLDYVRKEREVKYHEALFDMLSKQYEAARLDEAHDAPVLQVLDAASYPDAKSAPKRMYYMLTGLSLGLFAGSAWVLLRSRIEMIRAAIQARRQAAI